MAGGPLPMRRFSLLVVGEDGRGPGPVAVIDERLPTEPCDAPVEVRRPPSWVGVPGRHAKGVALVDPCDQVRRVAGYEARLQVLHLARVHDTCARTLRMSEEVELGKRAFGSRKGGHCAAASAGKNESAPVDVTIAGGRHRDEVRGRESPGK